MMYCMSLSLQFQFFVYFIIWGVYLSVMHLTFIPEKQHHVSTRQIVEELFMCLQMLNKLNLGAINNHTCQQLKNIIITIATYVHKVLYKQQL